MRVLQTRVRPEWVTKSKDPSASLEAWIGGAPGENLVDDAGLGTKVVPLEATTMDRENGIAFYAKDVDTLIRGFRYLGQNNKTKSNKEFTLMGVGSGDLAALFIRWDKGTLRNKNQTSAGIATVGFNISQFLTRTWVMAGGRSDKVDRYQSVSHNMEQAGRDGRLAHQGAAVYVSLSSVMPFDLAWGRTYRQIGDTMTMGTLASVTNNLAH
jgi:hypothetical protein